LHCIEHMRHMVSLLYSERSMFRARPYMAVGLGHLLYVIWAYTQPLDFCLRIAHRFDGREWLFRLTGPVDLLNANNSLLYTRLYNISASGIIVYGSSRIRPKYTFQIYFMRISGYAVMKSSRWIIHPSIHPSIVSLMKSWQNATVYNMRVKLVLKSLCKLTHVFEQLSSNEVSGIRLDS